MLSYTYPPQLGIRVRDPLWQRVCWLTNRWRLTKGFFTTAVWQRISLRLPADKGSLYDCRLTKDFFTIAVWQRTSGRRFSWQLPIKAAARKNDTDVPKTVPAGLNESSGREHRFRKKTWTLRTGYPLFRKHAEVPNGIATEQNMHVLVESSEPSSNLWHRPRICDGPRYATQVRRRPQNKTQMLNKRWEIEGDIGRTIPLDVRQTYKRYAICDAGHISFNIQTFDVCDADHAKMPWEPKVCTVTHGFHP